MKYIDLDGNKIVKETKQDWLLKEIYERPIGRAGIKLLVNPLISEVGEFLLNSRLSTVLIPSFVEKHHINMNEYCNQYYTSYNDFFTRKVKENYRPINQDEDCIVSPSDGKLSAYPINDRLVVTIKNTKYTVASLLRNKELATKYKNGTLVIIRLTVDDYHRFCYPVSGRKGTNTFIPGVLHTVNPIANDYFKIYKENSREYTVINTDKFGDIIQMEVGALLVGKITNYHQDREIIKGEEKGKFEFGGSSIVLLFEENRVEFVKDFIENTKKGYETMIQMGQPLAVKKINP